MRLVKSEIDTIKSTAVTVFGDDVVVRLFGSRAYDDRKGGDIDLHLEVDKDRCTLKREIDFQLRLAGALGERKVDIIIHERGATLHPIDRIAMKEGVLL